MDHFIGLAILAIFPVCMLFATFYDLFTMTIPNKISFVLLGSFLILAPLAGMGLETMVTSFAIALGVLTLGFILFHFGAMGGGDAKLLSASALWFGAFATGPYVLIGGALGGLLTLIVLVLRSYPLPIWALGNPIFERLHDPKNGVPYGAALGPAALFVFIGTPWMDYIIAGTPIG